MPKQIAAGLLAIVAMMSGAAAVAAGPADPTLAGDRPTVEPQLATGVLSPRRVPGVVSQLVGQVRLENGLLAVLRDERYPGAEAASCLLVEHGGQTIFSHRVDQPVIPASTLKLVTAWAALHKFGTGHRFTTEVRAPALPDGGRVERLWLVGGGDPLLATADYAGHFSNQPQTYTSIDSLADEIRRAGVTEVQDRIYGDDSRFDGQRYLPSWKDGYVTDNEVGPIGALVVNDNFTAWRPEDVAADDPAAHGAGVLSTLLSGRGVAVANPAASGRAPERGTALIARIQSPPMTAIVAQMMSESDNVTAEVLIKALGQRFGAGGSWEAGLAVVRDALGAAGYALDQLRQLDGSGLERDNRLTCSLLLDVLDDQEVGAALAAGLPVAGETGTLRVRLTDATVRGKVRAKTGSIDNVAGLVGYAESGAGPLEFALVANALPRSAQAAREFADAVARVLVAFPAVPSPAALGPQAPVAGPGPPVDAP